MNLTRCENGHFYDQDKFDSCPHCKGGAGATDKTESFGGTAPGTDFFDGDGGNVTVPLERDAGGGWNDGAVQATAPTAATEPAWVETPPVTPGFGSLSSKSTEAISGDSWAKHFDGPIEPNRMGMGGTVPGGGVSHNNGPQSDLQSMIVRAKGNGDTTTEKADEKTIGYYGDTGLGGSTQKAGLDPVVGWLVCIKGEEFGASFVLKSGKNFIGRDPKMDVVLAKDRSVSRQCHAIVLYDPKSRMFLVQPGTARELFYLNDKVVLGVEAIQNGDILSIGKTDLMFVPCCGPNFCWEDQIEKINEEANKKK